MSDDRVQLSLVERTVLVNQYEILKRLEPSLADHYEHLSEILREGYELNYGDALLRIGESLSPSECTYVMDVLDMYGALQGSARARGIYDDRLKFHGFDGNHESAHVSYAQFLRRNERWDYLDVWNSDLNSHFPTRSKYGEMLAVFRPFCQEALDRASLDSLTVEQIHAVLDAGGK